MQARYLGAALALACASAWGAGVTEEYDRFAGKARLAYTSASPARLDTPLFSLRATPGGVNAVSFMYAPGVGRYTYQKPLRFVGCRGIDWLVDGQPLALGMVVHDIKRSDRMLIEFLNQEVSTAQLAALGGASRVEYRLCGSVEGVLTAQDIAAAKEIAARLSR